MVEAEVGAWTPFKTHGSSGGLIAGAVIFLLIGIFSLYVTVIGVVFILIGVLFIVLIVLRMRKPKVRYVLTNRRAVVYSTTRAGQTELQACELRSAAVTVLNRRVISQTQGRGGGGLVGMAVVGIGGGSGRAVSQSDQVGDVLFMVGGVPQVRFVGCPDPEGVSATAVQLISHLKGV